MANITETGTAPKITTEVPVRDWYEIRKGSALCERNRKFDFKTSGRKEIHTKDAMYGINSLRKAWKGIIPMSVQAIRLDIMNQLKKDSAYESITQCLQVCKAMGSQIVRFLNYENDIKEIPWVGLDQDQDGNFICPEEKKVSFYGHEKELLIRVKPSFLAVRKVKDKDGNSLIELNVAKIKFNNSKSEFTQSQADKGDFEALELYLMLQYAKARLAGDEKVVLKSTIYRMVSGKDSDAKFEPIYNDGTQKSNTVVSLAYEYDPKTSGPDLMDRRFKKAIELYFTGKKVEECSATDCLYCKRRALCKFTKPPMTSNEVASEKKLSNVKFNNEQQEVIEIEEGIYRVIAPAGSGKTAVMVYHVAVLLEKGVAPEKILVFSFTNAAVDEFRARLALVLDDMGVDVDVNKVNISTFNAFKDNIIKSEFEKFGFNKEPYIADATEKGSIIKDIIYKNPLPFLDYTRLKSYGWVAGSLKKVAKVFEVMKRNNFGAGDEKQLYEALRDARYDYFSLNQLTELMKLYDIYCQSFMENALLEFSDQDYLVEQLLHREPDYFEQFGYEHILVDEAQDTNPINIELLQSFIDCMDFKELTLVGDDDQAIYASINGCSPELLLKTEEILGRGAVETIFLPFNYRSSKEICDFANNLIAKNTVRVSKPMNSFRGSIGKAVNAYPCASQDKEFEKIVEIVKGKLAEGYEPEDICILAWTKSTLEKITNSLNEAGIPSTTLYREKMLENPRIIASIALTHAILDETDTDDILIYANAIRKGGLIEAPHAFLQRAIDAISKDLDRIRTMKGKVKAGFFIKMLETIADDDELYLSFIDKVKTKESFSDMTKYILDYEEYGADEEGKREGNYKGVQVTTCHSSKGLEWKVVIASIDNFWTQSCSNIETREENRRLLFVAATRARDELFLVGTYGKGNYGYRSFLINNFWDEILPGGLDREEMKQICEADAAERKLLRDAEKQEWEDWKMLDILAHKSDYTSADVKKAETYAKANGLLVEEKTA